MEWLGSDLVSALRQLRRTPLATMAMLASLALGVGATTAIFSLLNSLILKPLPVPSPDALVSLREEGRSHDLPLSLSEFDALATTEGVPPVAAFAHQGLDTASSGQPARWVRGLFVSGTYFSVVGVTPALGRLLTPADDDRSAPAAVAVLSGAFWRSAFGGAPDIVGRSISIQGRPLEIVGVADPHFFGLEVGQTFDVAVPVSLYSPLFDAPDRTHNARLRWASVVGRLAPGQSLSDAVSSVRGAQPSVLRRAGLPPNVEEARLKEGWTLAETSASAVGARTRYGRPLLVLFGIVGFLLAVAGTNVAHLSLARGDARRTDLAVRAAMGASRGQLLRQMLVEALVVALVGIGVGIAIGLSGSRGIVALLATSRGSLALDLTVDWRVLAFTSLACFFTVVLASLLPAWRSSGVDPIALLRSGARGIIGGSRVTVRDVLTGAQVALAFVLTLGGIAFATSFVNLTTVPRGFDSGPVLLVGTRLGGAGTQPLRAEVAEAIRQRMRDVPGVSEAGLSWTAPFGLTTFLTFASTDGPPPRNVQDRSNRVDQNFVSAEYFSVLGIELLGGRLFEPVESRRDVVVVSRAFAQRYFGNRSPVGGRVWVTPFEQPLEVIGLVEDVKVRSLRDAPPPIAYHPWSARQYGAAFLQAVVRVHDRQLPADAVARAIEDLVPGAQVDVRSLDTELADTVTTDRTTATLASAFAGLGLLLAALGVHGVLSHHLMRRTAEMGVRTALGASPSHVIRELFGRTAVTASLGLVAGAALARLSSGWVQSQLYEVTLTEIGPTVGAALILLGVALIAAWRPTRRAAGLDPVAALREA